MKSIFEYMDFRKYLADYYAEQKAGNSRFSYRSFSDQIGFKTKDFIFRVIDGQKNLSKSSIEKISAALRFSKKEADYFEQLVNFTQAKTHEQKELSYKGLHDIIKGARYRSGASLLTHDQYRLFSDWYHLAVRSLIDLHEFRGDYEQLAKQVYPAITPAQAKKSVALLEHLGLVYQDDDGAWRVREKSITTGEEIEEHVLRNFYLACLRHAADALREVPRGQRNISGLTLGVSEKTYNVIVEKIQAFRKELTALADGDEAADRVYQLNFLVVPCSCVAGKKEVRP